MNIIVQSFAFFLKSTSRLSCSSSGLTEHPSDKNNAHLGIPHFLERGVKSRTFTHINCLGVADVRLLPVQRGGGLAETHVCSLYRHSSASWCGIQSCHWAAFVITTMISVSSSTFSPYNEEPFCCALIRSPRYRAAGLDQTQCSSCFTPVAPVLGSVGFKGKCC